MLNKQGIICIITALIGLLCAQSTIANVIYVDDDATGDNDGSRWENAYRCLQDALIDAYLGDKPALIIVAQGVYRPDEGVFWDPNDRMATFILINDVAIQGGYAGVGADDPDLRDINSYTSLLSGDLLGNDDFVGDPCDLYAHPSRQDNAYNVVYAEDIQAPTILDGFTIRGGNANVPGVNGLGGGLLSIGSSLRLTDCQFVHNSGHKGGGIYNHQGSMALTRCSFAAGYADMSGGGVYSAEGQMKYDQCSFSENESPLGAGLYNDSASPTLIECWFENNQASKRGAGIYNSGQSSPIIRDNTHFIGNAAAWEGGGVFNAANNESIPWLKDCSFDKCKAGIRGGGVFNEMTSAKLSFCRFTSNWSGVYGGAVFNFGECEPEFAQCEFNANDANEAGGAICNSSAHPFIETCIFKQNTSKFGGALLIRDSSPILNECLFEGNSAHKGGGIYTTESSSPSITSCRFIENQAESWGGAICHDTNFKGSPLLSKNLFEACEALRGGAIFDADTHDNIQLCVFERNHSTLGGGALYNHNSNTIIDGCRFISNTAGSFAGDPNFPFVGELQHDLDPPLSFLMEGMFPDGGAVYNFQGDPVITNCIFSLNCAQNLGGALYNYAPRYEVPGYIGSSFAGRISPQIANCTFCGNVAAWGADVSNDAGNAEPDITNCIFWSNLEFQSRRKYRPSFFGANVTYSIIEGGWSGEEVIDRDPLVTPQGFLLKGSPCIDGGDPNVTVDPNRPTDVNGETRITGSTVDIGADEFLDTDDDGLPDWWEKYYFGSKKGADPDGDSIDDDGLFNIEEYAILGSSPNSLPLYVDSNAPRVGADGTLTHSFPTLQLAIDAAQNGDTIFVAPGTYTGTGNYDLDFYHKSLILKNRSDDEEIIINCNGMGQAIRPTSTAGTYVMLDGFTIENGHSDEGGALRLESGRFDLLNCVLKENSAVRAGALGCRFSHLAVSNLRIEKHSFNPVEPNAGDFRFSHVFIEDELCLGPGTYEIVSTDFKGSGSIILKPNAHLKVMNYSANRFSSIRTNILGPGNIEIEPSQQLVFDGNTQIDLLGNDAEANGTIKIGGALIVKGNAAVRNANISVLKMDPADSNEIADNKTQFLEATAGYTGAFFVSGNAVIADNIIESDGDRYLDLDPADLCNANGSKLSIGRNEFYVTISEGRHGKRGGLFELRGEPNLFPCDPNPDNPLLFKANLDDKTFDTDSWLIEEIELLQGAKVNLTNRFDFQCPSNEGGETEVLYVKKLILGPNSVLNTAYNKIYYDHLYNEGGSIVNKPLLGFSLYTIAFNDQDEFDIRVVHNNFIHSDPNMQAHNRFYVARVAGPNVLDSFMLMNNLQDKEPNSPTEGEVFHARAKGLFAKSNEEQVLVTFEYLFDTDEADTELLVYLSDVPELQTLRDPNHHIEVGRIRPPRSGRPGSVDSDRFGTFHTYVNSGDLDFIRGTRVELELQGPAGTRILINNWDPQVQCKDECMNLDGEAGVTIDDLKPIIASFGSSARLGTDGTGNECLDGLLCVDGHVDSSDIISFEWALTNPEISNLCPDNGRKDRGLPLSSGESCPTCPEPFYTLNSFVEQTRLSALGNLPQGLVILGKTQYNANQANRLISEGLYFLNDNHSVDSYQDLGEFPVSSCNIRLVQGLDGNLYQVNIREGVYRIDLNGNREMLLPSNTVYRNYGQSADVYVGLQADGPSAYGRPVWDIAVTEHSVYVVPVVVVPEAGPSYLAAAQLDLDSSGQVGDIVVLYDDPDYSDANAPDNPDLGELREIELDAHGNVYVLNTESLNASEVLWKYGPDGAVLERLELTNPEESTEPVIPHPVGLCVLDDSVYLASGQNENNDPNSMVYGFSIEDLSSKASFAIIDMAHVTGMTPDASGRLWIVGLNVDHVRVEEVESWSNLTASFYEARIATISAIELASGNMTIPAKPVAGSLELGLPLSIVWHGNKNAYE